MIDRERLLKAAASETVVELPGVGPVRVRGLSRAEVVALQGLQSDLAALEKAIIVHGLVDPALTADEVDAWYGAVPSGVVDLITDAISDLSGLSEGATKSGLPRVRGERGP